MRVALSGELPQLPPHPLRVPHSAHLRVEAVGFVEVAIVAW